jgi:hypothetical protein
MKEKGSGKTNQTLKCQKCGTNIGGKAYYVVQLDCIYDGSSLSACDKHVVCSDCFKNLKSWLNLPQ